MENLLLARIREKITSSGPITFSEFMETALYDPDYGYYTSGRVRIGPGLDFVTAPHQGVLFARALGRFVIRADEALNRPDPFTLVEGGPGEGKLARDLLDYLNLHAPSLYARLRYFPVEISDSLKMRQRERLAPHAGLVLDELPLGYEGVFYSNELLDAFPVRRFAVRDGTLFEAVVAVGEDGLQEVLRQTPEDDASALARETASRLSGDEYSFEVCPKVKEWLAESAASLKRGYLLTIDYGDLEGRLCGPFKPAGTVRGFKANEFVEDLYAQPGTADITASVNFSALMEAGRGLGLSVAPLQTQAAFLLALGIHEEAEKIAEGLTDVEAMMKFQSEVWPLLFPGSGMGESFKASVMAKDAPDLGLSEVFSLESDEVVGGDGADQLD